MTSGGPVVDRRAMWVLYGGFVLVGVATVLPGPLIPELRTAWGLDHARVAILFPAFFVASGIGSVLSDWNLRLGLFGGYAAMIVGFVGLAFGVWPIPVVAMSALGLGVGLVAPCTNFLVAYAAEPGQRSADLATLNLIWGVGATGCPLLLAAMVGRVATSTVLIGFAVLVGLALLALVATFGRGPSAVAPSVVTGTPDAANTSSPSALASASLWPIAGLIFFYVGVESAVSGWVVSLAEALDGGPSTNLLAHAAFWGLLLAGRGLTPLALRRWSDRQVYVGGWGLAGLGVFALLGVASPVAVIAAAGVTGLGLGPMFPLTVSFLAERTAGGRSGGWVFAFAGFGGAVVPWIAGRVAGSMSIQSSFWVPVAALAVLITLFAATRTAEPAESAAAGLAPRTPS
ncbi:MAG: hypothetical protein AAGE94_07880 [Acidobacteriota bacterium]